MNRIKFTLLAASLSFAVIISCSDDSNGNNGSNNDVIGCRTVHTGVIYCKEWSVSYIKSETGNAGMAEWKKDCLDDSDRNEGIFTEVLTEGCPNGEILKCSRSPYISYYYYSSHFEGVNCDDPFYNLNEE